MCILLTPVLYFVTTVKIEVYLQCFSESVSLRDIGRPSSRAEISSPSSLYFKAVKGAHLGSGLICITLKKWFLKLTECFRFSDRLSDWVLVRLPRTTLTRRLKTKYHQELCWKILTQVVFNRNLQKSYLKNSQTRQL